MEQKVLRTGNSLGVTVPSDFVKAIGIRAGDNVVVKQDLETGRVIYTFHGAKQLSLPQAPGKKKRRR